MEVPTLNVRGLSLHDLAVEVNRRKDTMEDFIADTQRIGFVVDPEAEPDSTQRVVISLDAPVGEDELLDLPVNWYAQRQIAQRLQIGVKFWERMRNDHPDILEDTVRKLFVREPSKRMVRALDGRARAFLSNHYRRLDYFDMMERSILPALGDGEGMQVFSCGITDVRLYMKIIFPDVKVEVTPGDEVSCGIILGNSEVGAGSFFVEPFTYRWACENGCIMGYKKYSDFGLRQFHLGRALEDTVEARAIFTDETLRKEDEAFFSMVYDLVANAKNGVHFAAIASRMKELAGIKVEGNHQLVVERLAKTHSFNETERISVMQHLIEGGDLSAWGYLNAVTRMAQDVEKGSYDRAVEIERVGGQLMEMTPGRWNALAVT